MAIIYYLTILDLRNERKHEYAERRREREIKGKLMLLRAFHAHVIKINGGWPILGGYQFTGSLQLMETQDSIWLDLDHVYDHSAEVLAGCENAPDGTETRLREDIENRLLVGWGTLQTIHDIDSEIRAYYLLMKTPSELQQTSSANKYDLFCPPDGNIFQPIFNGKPVFKGVKLE